MVEIEKDKRREVRNELRINVAIVLSKVLGVAHVFVVKVAGSVLQKGGGKATNMTFGGN